MWHLVILMILVFPQQNISIKPIIMHAMAEWYIRGDSDQTKLSRILDVAQDLKVTSFSVLSHCSGVVLFCFVK
jgi:hypothetical protein